INNHKRKLANIYLENLNSNFILPEQSDDQHPVYHIFNIRHQKRDKLKEYLENHGISTEIHYPIAPHHQKALKNEIKRSFPISEEIHRTTLSLPCSYSHTEEEIYKTVDLLNRFSTQS